MKGIKLTNPNLISFAKVVFYSLIILLPLKNINAKSWEFNDPALNYSSAIGMKTRLTVDDSQAIQENADSTILQIEDNAAGKLDTSTNDVTPEMVHSQAEPKKQKSSVSTILPQYSSINSKDEKLESLSFSNKNIILKLLFGEQKVLEFRQKLVKYVNRNYSGEKRMFFLNLIDQILKYPIVLAFSFLICFFILHVVLVVSLISYTNRRKNYMARYRVIYGNLYEKVTLSYLFGEINWDTYKIKLKHIAKERNRRILIEILLNFHDNLKGGIDEQIPEIYRKLDLKKDSYKAVNSFLYYRKVKGLHTLTNLYPDGAREILPRLLKHSNESIRSEAHQAYILLNPDNPFNFLKTLTKPFSRWTQLSAFHLLRLPQIQVPSFSRYLLSTHNGVRIFCLQMINYFQQLENVNLIFNLLESNKELTRYLSYRAINNLRLYDGRVLIKQQYRDETEKNKLEIIKALRNIGNQDDIDFLEIIFKSESTAMQIEACRTMYYMSPESKERLINVSKKAIPNLDLFIAHVTDKRN